MLNKTINNEILYTYVYQVNLDCRMSVDVLHRLFESVAPSVFRPVDSLLKALFCTPQDLVSCLPFIL